MGHNSERWQAYNMAEYLCTVALVVLAAALAQAQYNNYYGYGSQNYYNDYNRRYNDYNSQFNSYYLDQPAFAYGRQYRGVTVSYGPSGSCSYPGFYSRNSNYGGAYNNYYNRYYNDYYNNRFNNQQQFYSRYYNNYNNNNNFNRFNNFNRNQNFNLDISGQQCGFSSVPGVLAARD